VGVLLAAALTIPSTLADTGEQQAKTAALEFGRALKQGDTSLMRPVLPSRGKVRLRLIRFGPEDGSYSADQVQVLFKDFLRHGAVRSFDLLRLQCASEQFALVHSRVRIADRDGRPAEVDLHVTFQPEGDRWVVREIRETPP
jgi:hypothetical protein